jgi:hypothetical protein
VRHHWITALAALSLAAGTCFGATSVNLEFNGSGNTLAATGFDNVYNLDDTLFTVGGGSLTLTTNPTDIYGNYENDPDTGKNVFYSNIDPLYKTVVDTKVTYNNLNHNFQGGGIWLGTDEDHYVRLGVVNADPNIRVEYIRENSDLWTNYGGPGGDIQNTGGAQIVPSPQTAPLTVYLRISREGRSATASYSLNGTDYITVKTWDDVATAPSPDYPHIAADATCKVGVYAFGDPGDPADPNYKGNATVAFDYVHATSAQADRPFVELTTANGYNWFLKPGVGDATYYGTTLDETTDGSWLARPVPDPDWGNGPGLDGTGEFGAPVFPRTLAYGWYRLHFTTPPSILSVPGRQVIFRVLVKNGEAIGDIDATYLNGTLIGTTGQFPSTDTTATAPNDGVDGLPNYYPGAAPQQWQERNYTFPASLLKSGANANVIAIKAFNRSGNGGLIGIPELQVAPPTVGVTGTVTSGGSPVANARVAAMDDTGLVSDAALTDAQGKFTLGAVTPGSVTLGVAKPGLTAVSKSLGTLTENQTVAPVAITTTPIAQAGSPLWDDFSDGPNGWKTKWDAVSEVAPASAVNPASPDNPVVTEPGINQATQEVIPSTLTYKVGGSDRGGILSKARVSHVASVNAARIVSARANADGGSPNIILQLNGTTEDDLTKMPGYGEYPYIEFDMEGLGHALDPSGNDTGIRLQWIVWINGLPSVRGIFPMNLASFADITPANPLDLTVTRTGTYYDFYLNDQHVYGCNTFIATMPNHKVDLYSFPHTDAANPTTTGGSSTYDWVHVSAVPLVTVPDTTAAVKALRIAGGLDTSTPADVTSSDVVGGDGKITVADAVGLLRGAVGTH